MHYSTEWIVILFVLAVAVGIGWQVYQAGHLGLLAIAGPAALACAYALNRWERGS